MQTIRNGVNGVSLLFLMNVDRVLFMGMILLGLSGSLALTRLIG